MKILFFLKSFQITTFFFIFITYFTIGSAYADEYSDVAQLIKSQQYNAALAKIDQVLVNKPKDLQMRFFKGVVQTQNMQTQAAIQTFLELTQEYPELSEPYNNLATLYAKEGDLEKAKNALEQAIRNNSRYATAHENLGDIYLKLAQQSYLKATQLGAKSQSLTRKTQLLQQNLQ